MDTGGLDREALGAVFTDPQWWAEACCRASEQRLRVGCCPVPQRPSGDEQSRSGPHRRDYKQRGITRCFPHQPLRLPARAGHGQQGRASFGGELTVDAIEELGQTEKHTAGRTVSRTRRLAQAPQGLRLVLCLTPRPRWLSMLKCHGAVTVWAGKRTDLVPGRHEVVRAEASPPEASAAVCKASASAARCVCRCRCYALL